MEKGGWLHDPGNGGGNLQPPTLQSPGNGATLTSRTVTFSWQAPNISNISGYTLHVSTSSTIDGVSAPLILDTGVGGTSYTYTFSQDYTELWWSVATWVNSSRRSGFASAWTFAINTSSSGGISPPTLQSPGNGATLTSRTVTFSWQAPNSPNISGYTLHISTNSTVDGAGSNLVLSIGVTGTSYTYTFSQDYTALWWSVAASNSSGQGSFASAWTFAISTTPPDTTPPMVDWLGPVSDGGVYHCQAGPVQLLATASDNVAVAEVNFIRWDAVNLQWIFIGSVTSAPYQASIDCGTLNFAWNQVNVGAYDTSGNPSATGPYIWIYRDSTPAAPSNLSAQATSCAQVTLSWTDNSNNEDGFKIYRNNTYLGQVGANVTSYQDSGAQAHTSYTYTVTAFIGTLESGATNAATVTTAGCMSKTWYFAEGYTGGSFSEYLTLENPNATATTATVTYLLDQGQAPIVKTYTLAANSRTTLLVNNEVGPNHNVSMVVSASQPIVAERPMYFTYTALPGYTIPGGTDVLGATSLSQQFDFGYLDTTAGHDPYLTFLNPNGTAMNVTIQYFGAAGGAPTVTHHTFAANSRGTINVRTDEGLAAGTYSALVSLDQPGLVERPLYLKDSVTGYTGSADVVGVANPQTDWYFAEGYTNTNFSERYYLSNPNLSGSASATVTFFLSNGTTQTKTVSIPAGGQVMVDANAVLGNNVNNSAHVNATLPILAERFMSFDYTAPIGENNSPSIPGATDVLGTGAPSNLFYFSEGYDGTGFAEYLTIENPSTTQTATVTVIFYPDTASTPTVRTYTIAPSSRFTLFTADVMPNAAFSMEVVSNVAIVAERPMYFNYLNSGQTGGSDVVGYQP